MVRKLFALFAITSSLALSACNTVHGAANDVGSVTECADGKENNC